ncbi:hypothetical protein DFH06DRAFT_1407053, partial [Mycena polygramma]
MVLGFFKHVFRYFRPQDATSHDAHLQPRPDVQLPTTMVPCFNENGLIVAYRSVINPNYNAPVNNAPPENFNIPSRLIPAYVQTPIPINPGALPSQHHYSVPHPLYTVPGPPYVAMHAPGAQAYAAIPDPPSAPGQAANSHTAHPPDTDRRISPAQPAQTPVPASSAQRADSISSTSSSRRSSSPSAAHSDSADAKSSSKPKVDWDPWPDGDFEMDFTWPEFHATGELHVHWACEPVGGDKHGVDSADDWVDGKKTRRRCRGIIRCRKSRCTTIVRPQTRMKGIQKQLLHPCLCGAQLFHLDCGLVSTSYSFSGGVHYVNGGTHDHPRPTHILHLTSKERSKFVEIVREHPKVGPLSLLVGRPGLHGPEKSVAEISPVLFNKDRIKSERRAIKRQGDLADSDFAQFAQFERENPGFIIFSQFGAVTVIVMQTPFMVSQLVKTHIILRDAINGIVSDGAHGYFIEHNALLLMSSSYCLDLDCWVPGIMSYTNGATQQHYCIHFLCLFETMASYAESQGIKISDATFKNVVDFSDPQRLGFVDAFVLFWTRRKDDFRTERELRQAGSALLKGCQQHYRAQVNRVKKISAVVAPGLQDVFANEAMALIHAEDYDDFTQRSEQLIKKFPKAEGWARWWAREPHAKMLFKPFREMPVHEWDSIPNTTNPQESQHFKIYSAIGKKHALIPGLKGLRQLAHHYHMLANAVSGGIRIRYGKAEAWKHGLGRASRQKGSGRSSRKEGRPPDTAKELAGKGSRTRGSRSSGYSWDRNSCYLDTSLELIFHTVLPGFEREWGARADTLHDAESIKKLFEFMSQRLKIEIDSGSGVTPGVMKALVEQRNKFRKFLEHSHIVPDPYAFNPLFAWLEKIVSHQHNREDTFARSYFHSYSISLRTCPGDDQNRSHLHLKRLNAAFNYNLTAELWDTYHGDVAKWFRTIVRVDRDAEHTPSCWRNVDNDGHPTCAGAATLLPLLLGIPVMLILEVPGDWHGRRAKSWNFPERLRPLTASAATTYGVEYEIVGRAFTNGGHFTASFTTDGTNTYSYDDTKNGGCAVLAPDACLAGKAVSKPGTGWRTYAVVYRLRGGTRAQTFFSRSQVAAVQRHHSIRFAPASATPGMPYTIPDVVGFDLPNLTELAGEDRFWLHSPWRTDILDFVSSQPRKRVRFINDDGDGEDDVSDSPRPPKKHRSNLILSSDDESGSDSEPKAANKATAKSTPIIDHEDTEFDVDCRCGQQGVITGIPSELLAKCSVCGNFSHVACQPNGSAATTAARKKFRCYSCHSPSEILGVHRPAPTKRKRKKPDAPSRTKLTNRLLAGKGALARYGTYWYPVRLIHKHAGVWEVKWWRGNQYSQPDSPSNQVAEGDLVDELWANAGARRAIQLGRWTHACETGVEEDEVFEFLRAPYTEEIETALRPHIDILQQLRDDPDGHYPLIPASVFSSQQRFAKSSKGSEMMRHGGIPHTGDLRSTDCAGVANWVHHCVRGAKNSTSSWMGRVPLAHAYTLLIAHRHHTEILAEIDAKPKYASMDRQVAILELAWTRQKRPMHRYPDVDHECLNIFEERLFEYSFATGRAGNHQWGLDIGPHQEGWNPYANIPAHWNHDDREDESESELAVRTDS